MGEIPVEAFSALSGFMVRAATIYCRLSLPELRALISKSSHDPFSASTLWKLDITVPASADEVYPLLVPLLKRAPKLRFLALADSRRRKNANVEGWQVNPLDLVANFPTLLPELSSLELTGDYVAGFLASIDSDGFSFPHLRQLQLSHALKDHVINILTSFQRPKGFNSLIIDEPFYRIPADLRELAEAVTAFFSSSPHPVHFRDLGCSVYEIGTEFNLQTSVNEASSDEVEIFFALRLLDMYGFVIEPDEVVPAVLDGLTLDLIEKVTIGGPDFPQLTRQSWKFNETLQTLVLRDIKTSFLDWTSYSPTPIVYPNLKTLVIETMERPTKIPKALRINLLSFGKGGEGGSQPLLVIKGDYLPAFDPRFLLNMGVVDRIQYHNGLDNCEVTTEFTDWEDSDQEGSDQEDSDSNSFTIIWY
ncbi:hypothetical protein DL96DRAFT_1686652 [Flagelloscypha sp. PMI_526]|nr:hypothetical protein DL96DRAFT_1686652 [Flagelloscypha sp. PMI_526]